MSVFDSDIKITEEYLTKLGFVIVGIRPESVYCDKFEVTKMAAVISHKRISSITAYIYFKFDQIKDNTKVIYCTKFESKNIKESYTVNDIRDFEILILRVKQRLFSHLHYLIPSVKINDIDFT